MRRMSLKILLFFMPLLLIVVYMLAAVGLQLVVPSPVAAQTLVNLVVIVGGFLLYRKKRFRREFLKEPEEPFRPKAWAVFLFLCLIFLLWFFTQCMALCVSSHVADAGMNAYQDTANNEIAMYVLMSVAVSPIAEEFLFRAGLFQTWKHMMHPLYAMFLSSVLFAVVHGTFQHLPVAFLIGVFNCVIWELTGSILYPMVTHILFNFLGVSMLIPINESAQFLFSIPFAVISFVVILVCLLWLYARRVPIRKFVTSDHLIDYLNRKWDEDEKR